MEGVPVASLTDIGFVKLDALISRGSRKDFYDLFFISREVPLDRLLSLADAKYCSARDFKLMALESLVLFDNADRDVQPDLLVPVPWAQVRDFFVAQGKRLGYAWFSDEEQA